METARVSTTILRLLPVVVYSSGDPRGLHVKDVTFFCLIATTIIDISFFTSRDERENRCRAGSANARGE
jgi:hypothetical protein